MTTGTRRISAQLRVSDAEIPGLSAPDIERKIDAARDLAGVDRLLFQPSTRRDLNERVLGHCRKRGMEIHLWHKALANNFFIPEKGELIEDAWGGRGIGESGVWNGLPGVEDNHFFACPRNAKYNQFLIARCAQNLRDYDGLYLDTFGLPPPSLGLEALFACFCPSCLAVEPRLEEWRRRARDMRETAASASDADLRKWGTFTGVLSAFGLSELFEFRRDSATQLAARYAELARLAGKPFGLDLHPPALALFAGHDYRELGKLADWVKPRIYFRIFGPTGITLEFYCLTMGMMAWGKRYTIPAILEYIGRSTGLAMPRNIHALAQDPFPDRVALAEIPRAEKAISCPVHPGLEFSLHPDYDTELDGAAIRTSLEAARHSPGLVLAWNLLYIPDEYLKIIGREWRR